MKNLLKSSEGHCESLLILMASVLHRIKALVNAPSMGESRLINWSKNV